MANPAISSRSFSLPQAPTSTPKRSAYGRADAICLLALLILSLLSWLPKWTGPLDYRWDGGTYFILGTSLAEWRGYRLLNEPGNIRADQYPPLLPMMIAAHQMALKSTDPVKVGIWLRRTWIILSVAYILGSFLLARLFMSWTYALWLALICLLSYDMYYLSTLCFAELPFALATVAFAWLYLSKAEASWRRRLAPAFAIAGYLLRSLGIALLAAWVADALFRRQFRAAAIRAVVALVPVSAWQLYVHDVERAPDYQHPYYAYQRDASMFYNVSYSVNMRLKEPFQPDLGQATPFDLASRFLRNIASIPSSLGQSITARQGFFRSHVNSLNRTIGQQLVPHWPYQVLLNLLGIFVLLGAIQLALARQWIVALTILLTVLAVCTTPWPGQFARYLAPILPLLLIATMTLLRGVVDLRQGVDSRKFSMPGNGYRRLRILRICAAGLILLESCIALASGSKNFIHTAYFRDENGRPKPYHVFHYSTDYPDSEDALRWLAKRADPHAVVATSMPQWVYLQSGFKTVMPPLTSDLSKAQDLADSVPVSYVLREKLLMDDNFLEAFPRMVKNRKDKWKLVYSSADNRVQLYGRFGIAMLSGKVLTDEATQGIR